MVKVGVHLQKLSHICAIILKVLLDVSNARAALFPEKNIPFKSFRTIFIFTNQRHVC